MKSSTFPARGTSFIALDLPTPTCPTTLPRPVVFPPFTDRRSGRMGSGYLGIVGLTHLQETLSGLADRGTGQNSNESSQLLRKRGVCLLGNRQRSQAGTRRPRNDLLTWSKTRSKLVDGTPGVMVPHRSARLSTKPTTVEDGETGRMKNRRRIFRA